MTETDIAYAAGLIDGEGSVLYTRNHGSDKFGCPTVSMTSTTPALIDFMKINFGGTVSNHKVYKSHHKPSQVWKVCYNAAISCLELTAPYLREPEKLRRANLILTKYKAVTKRNGKYSESELAAKLAFDYEFYHPSTT